MQTPENYVNDMISGKLQLSFIEAIAARDAEWQTRVEKLEAALNGLLRCWDLVCDTHDWDPNHLNEVLAARAALGRD